MRSLEDRQTIEAANRIKRAESRERRLKNKEAAREYIKTLVASKVPGKAPRERNNIYLAWLRRLPCVACMVRGGDCGPTEAAHLRFSDASRGRINSGMQAKPSDKWATPLGHGCHQNDQHRRSERAFWQELGIDVGQLCEDLFAGFLAGTDGLVILRKHTRIAVQLKTAYNDGEALATKSQYMLTPNTADATS